jgi:hypothetical protein
VIRVCVQEGVPIYQGKIDKSLFAMVHNVADRAEGAEVFH